MTCVILSFAMKIAIDVGGVLIDMSGEDTNFDPNAVVWMPRALEAIKALSTQHELYILSFCGRRREMETRVALRHKVLDSIPEKRWFFTRHRLAKRRVMRQLKLDVLVDDTEEVVQHVRNDGIRVLWFGSTECLEWTNVCDQLLVV
jgi:hypothetical protein